MFHKLFHSMILSEDNFEEGHKMREKNMEFIETTLVYTAKLDRNQ